MSQNDWYSNKDLFEQISALRNEMQETRVLIKSYNGLREQFEEIKKKVNEVEDIAKKVNEMEAISKGKAKAGDNINKWVLFSFATLTIAMALINFFKG